MRRLLLILCLLATPLWAVEPDEMLADLGLEARAREISTGLRCLVCRNESIDESHAELAHDLRLLVRERLVEGDSDAEVVAYVVERYGEYVLLRPTTTGANLVLWLAGPVMALLGLAMAFGYLRRQSRRKAEAEADPAGLSATETARLREIMKD